MKSLPKPSFGIAEFVRDCCGVIRNHNLKRDFSCCAPQLIDAEGEFMDKFPRHKIYELYRGGDISNSITKDEMTKMYDSRMVQSRIRSQYYDLILASAPNGLCPQCYAREANTLDHYLPKAEYPQFAVTPINLVPSCMSCNKDKLSEFPTCETDQLLHPYFDNIEPKVWLMAEVLHTTPVGFRFYVNPSVNVSSLLYERIENTFNSYKLSSLYATKASQEFTSITRSLQKAFMNRPNGLQDFLKDAYESREEAHGINGWQTVFYLTLLNDEWIINGGFIT